MSYYGKLSEAEFLEWLSHLPELALDIETAEGIIIGVGLGTDVTLGYFSGRDVRKILPFIVDIQSLWPIVMHNGKSDVTGIRASFPNDRIPMIRVWDTMVAASLLLQGEKINLVNLKDVAAQVLHVEIDKYDDVVKRYKARDLSEVPEDKVAVYNLSQVAATWQLYEAFLPEIMDDEQLPQVFELEMEILPILAQMEENGVLIDAERLALLRERYVAESDAYLGAVETLTGDRITNVNSPKQVREFLYGFLGHRVGKTTDSGAPSTDEKTLRKIAASDAGRNVEYKWIRPLLHARQTVKLVGTYCDGIADRLDGESRSHTSFSQVTADTGRLASKDPNHQNRPKRRGPEIRRCFVAPEGYVLVAADMDQLELRIIAEEAGETLMQELFLSGGDIHMDTAVSVLHDPAKRFVAKILNYTIVYLAGPQQIADQISDQGVPTSKAAAERMQQSYFRRYYKLTNWMKEWTKLCTQQDYVETWYGRRRDLAPFHPQWPTTNWITDMARKSVNTRIQGTAAEIMKLNMVKVENALRLYGCVSRQLIQIHDEILLEVPLSELALVQWILRTNMSTQYKNMPLPCTIKVGTNWGDVK